LARKTYIYHAKIKRESLPPLQDLARQLGFLNTTGGSYDASPPELFDALAAAYERNPEEVVSALKALGVGGEQKETTG